MSLHNGSKVFPRGPTEDPRAPANRRACPLAAPRPPHEDHTTLLRFATKVVRGSNTQQGSGKGTRKNSSPGMKGLSVRVHPGPPPLPWPGSALAFQGLPPPPHISTTGHPVWFLLHEGSHESPPRGQSPWLRPRPRLPALTRQPPPPEPAARHL